MQELGDLLELAEKVQASYESSMRRESFWRLLEGMFLLAAISLLVLGLKSDGRVGLLAAGVAVVGYAVAVDVFFVQRIRRSTTRDRYALKEVLGLLHELQGVIDVESDWTALQRAEFRIRLSRFELEPPPQSVFDRLRRVVVGRY